MRTLRRFLVRLRHFVAGSRQDERLREEMESHLAAQTEAFILAGRTPGQAAREARLKFGAVETVRADHHAENGFPWLEDLIRDGRYALRGLRRSPAFTLVAVLSLGLGIAANVVVFGIVNALLLRPLAVSNPQNLYQLRQERWTSFKLLTTPYPVFEDYTRRSRSFSGLAGFYGYAQTILRSPGTTLSASGYAVTGNYFDLLGIRPQLGRLLHPSDEHGPNSAPYVVLSDGLWRRAFNADPGVIGQTVQLYRQPFTVVGVAPAGFQGTERLVWPDFWMPLVNYFDADYLRNRTAVALTVLGRLKAGVTPAQAAGDLGGVATQLAWEYPSTDNGSALRLVRPGLYGDTGDVVRGFLYTVTGLALLVLLAACANLASLFAARAADRGRELSLRVALGASRGRLVRQLMTEALTVSILGGAAGLAAGSLLLGVLGRSSIPGFVGKVPGGRLPLDVDARVYLVALGLTLLSGLLSGLTAARQVRRSDPLRAMKGGPRDLAPSRGPTLRDGLLIAQVAVCALLVTASFVAVRGMVRALRVPLGFRPQGALLAELDLSELPGGDVPPEKKQAMIEAVRNIPGVQMVGTVSKVPFTGGLRGVPVFPPGTTELTLKNSVLSPYVFTMSPGYLEAAGTRLLGGRDVSWHDTAGTPSVAVVNATFARRMWGDAPAIGQRFILLGHLTEVVGVAEDGKYYQVQEEPQPVVFLPLLQDAGADTVFVVRSSRAQNEAAAALVRTLNALEPNAPVAVRSWSETLGGALFAPRAATLAVGVMGALAVMLAVTGVFGMAAYNVSRRTRELGIRVALGARRKHVLKAAVGRPLALLAAGSAAGLLLGISADRWMASVVYQANSQEPIVLGGVLVTMALLGVVASAIPALRALAIEPARLLREE